VDKYELKRYMEAEPGAKLKDLVTKLLYDEIVSLRILPGTKLNVNQLAASLGVSRTPVAEAVAGLADIGFVVTRPGQSGSFVLDLNMVDMIHLYHVRNAIESEAAALCAYAASDTTVRELTMMAEAFKTSVEGRDIRGMRETDMPFHRLIIQASGNPYLVRSYEDILPKLTMYQASMLNFIVQQDNDANPWMASVKYNHISVVSAIRMRMPELARQSMAEHVGASLNFTSLSGDGADPFRVLRKG
jgi:DNA-binding GntR family transcriptional regulator